MVFRTLDQPMLTPSRAFLQEWIIWSRPPSYWHVLARHLPVAVVAGLPLLAVGLWPWDRIPLRACTFLAWTGLPCPFCGFTRAFAAISRGDLAWAWAFCPLALPLYLAFLITAVWHGAGLVLGRQIIRGPRLALPAEHRRWLWRVAAGLFLLNWAYRLAAGLA